MSINLHFATREKRKREETIKPRAAETKAQQASDGTGSSEDDSDDEIPEDIQTALDARKLLRALGCKPVKSF